VSVIELDDRSHERADRQAADTRKNKVLADAGVRLVRIPAGALPSEQALREMIDVDWESVIRTDGGHPAHFVAAGSDLQLAEEWGRVGEDPTIGLEESRRVETSGLKRGAMKIVFLGIVLVGGWFVVSRFLPYVVQRALQPLAVLHVAAASPPVARVIPAKSHIPVTSGAAGLSAEELAERRRAEIQAAAAVKKQKDLAWAAFYSAPASCEHPADWAAQVECGNRHMRAKKEFEMQWEIRHPVVDGTVGGVVPDNPAIGGLHR
jgi:hypothetical protein